MSEQPFQQFEQPKQPEFKPEFESRHEALAERMHLKSQWESQVKILNESGILETLPETHGLGIVGIDGNEYSIPKYQEILSSIDEEQLTILEQKESQGFTKMLLVPFAMPLDILIDRFKRLILKHHKEGKLLGTDGSKLKLDVNNPFDVWENYKQADQKPRTDKDALFYYSSNFDSNNPNIHQGKTKQELIDQQEAWQVHFIEDLPDLSAKGEGQTKGGRLQLEANKSSIDYLELTQENPVYQHELGSTPELELTYAITHLKETNQMIDDWRGKGKLAKLFGACLSDYVSVFGWYRDGGQAGLGRYRLGSQSGYYCARSSVKIKILKFKP